MKMTQFNFFDYLGHTLVGDNPMILLPNIVPLKDHKIQSYM